MAEFALGLTKTAVEGTVSRVKLAIEEEAKLKVRVQNDLVFITGEFQMMQSFLKVANNERAKNEVVRTWVRQIRELAFDVEDCVELIVSLDLKSGWSWLWRVLPGCMAPPRPLDQAVAEIQRLKARVEDVSHRNTRYNLISDPGSDCNSSTATIVSSMVPELIPAMANDAAGASSSTFQLLQEVWEAAGKMRHDKEDLRKLLANEGSDLEVISLWGSQGPAAADLGTTSILRTAYNDPKICQDFKIRAWVKLTHPFSPDKFLKRLLTQFCASSQRANIQGPRFQAQMRAAVSRNDDLMKAQLMQQVTNEQRYLVIVQELSTVEEWEAIRMYLPDTKNGSRIIVATQQLGLALSCIGVPYQVFELRKFSDGQSLCAFLHKKVHSKHNRGSPISSRTVDAHKWLMDNTLIGRKSEQNRIRLSLQDGHVTSVWGVAGVGKSALVRSIYYSNMIDRVNQLTKYSWVDVPLPFNLTEFCRRLLMDFHSTDFEARETALIDMMEGQDPIQLCREFLQQGKCVAVIDGLCSTNDWDLIKDAFLAKPIKGHILVITNEESIAMYCAYSKNDVINIQGLEDEAALKLLTKTWREGVFTRVVTNSNEVHLSRLIIAKCGGLPKVITAIGKYIRHGTRDSISHVRKHWIVLPPGLHEIIKGSLEHTYDEFMSLLETNPMFHSLRGLFYWIQSYFHDCPDSLKPCIFYLSIFPSSHDIRRKRLLRRWIAEGYSTEENVEKLFADFVKLSIIQQQSPSRRGVCQFNGFFREYIISRPMQDNLVFELDGHCSLDSQRAGKHLTISINWDRAKILFESMELSRLRSLTVFGEWRSFFISADAKMKMLRVLDLEDTSGVTDDDLKHIGKLMPQLKFLSLRGCKDITCLPSSLGCLRQLQTLDIKCTSIVTLPPAIMKLEKLQYVRAGTRGCGSATPKDNNGAAVAKTPPTGGDGASTSQALAPPPTSAGGKSTRQSPPAAAADDARTLSPWRIRPHGGLAFSWVSRFCRNEIVSGAHDGVQFPAAATGGIRRLKALHTLGVLNVQGASGKVVIRELKKLEQLRRLKLFGINRTNWLDFCFGISGHCYLESLSVRLVDYKQQDHPFVLDDISKPPKTLKCLKLYGGSVQVSPVWIKQLDGLTKVDGEDLQLTVSTQLDINNLVKVPCQNMFRRICIKAIQDGKLRYGGYEMFDSEHPPWPLHSEPFSAAKVLKIDCGSYKLQVVLEQFAPKYIEVMVVHCSTTNASLELSGLSNLGELKKVWLKGTYSDAVKQHLENQVAMHEEKPIFKVYNQQSSATRPSAC